MAKDAVKELRIDIYIVQHGEKETTDGDPALSAAGVTQARLTGRYLATRRIDLLYASPLRRARQTAAIIADAVGLAMRVDDRLRERMNWGDSSTSQTREDFLAEWARATRDRDFTPRSGDSSRAAGRRALSLLDEVAQCGGRTVALVAHGGVTVDLLRNLFPDDVLRTRHPDADIIAHGIPGCAITHLVRRGDTYDLRTLASVAHLPAAHHTGHHR